MSLNPIVGSPPTQPSSTVTQCVQQILAALSGASTIAQTDKDAVYFLLDQQDIPYDGAGQKTAAPFSPTAADFNAGNKDFTNPITDAVTQITNSINNPLSGVGAGQNNLFNSFQGSGSVFDQVQAALRSFFLLGSQSDSNLAGLLLFAVEETMPSMANTQVYIKKMEALVKQLIESCSKLPNAFIPEIPNLIVLRNLCDADSQLSQVASELSQYQTLNSAALANAKDKVCSSIDIVKTGIVPPEAFALLQSVFGLSDLQIKTIATSRFTPDPSFNLKLQQLQTLNQFLQQNSPDISDLNQNILTLLDTLANIDSIGIGSLMAVMITAVQSQIKDLRVALETEVVNFVRQQGYTVSERIVTEIGSSTQLNGSGASPLPPSYSAVVDNSATFTQLSALCIVLGKLNAMYSNLQKILTQQSRTLLAIKKFVHQHILNACSTASDATPVDIAVKNFVTAMTIRLSGQAGTNNAVTTTGQALLAALKAYKGFVGCLQSSVTAGRINITNVLNTTPGNPGHAPASVGNISELVQFMPQLKSALRTLDIKRITGVQAKEYDALTKLLAGLQCLAGSCNNNYVREVCRTFMVLFQKKLDKRKSVALTQGSLGKNEVPSRAWQANIDYQTKATQKNLDDLKTFVSSPLDKACNVVNTAASKINPADSLIQIDSITPTPTSTRAGQAQLEAAQRSLALSNATALGNPNI